jgi:hypothetical protein
MTTPCFFSVRLRRGTALVAALLILGSLPGHAAGITARAAVDKAIETALQWRPDAILTSIYTATADVEGRSTFWTYGFHSPRAGNYLNVTVRGRAVETLEIAVGQKEMIPKDFLESDQVIAEAVKAGIEAETVRMRLTKTEWLVNSGDQKGALTVWLNPRTGKLIKKQVVQ